MPRVILTTPLDFRSNQDRLAVIARARELVENDPEPFASVGAWLEAEYSDEVVVRRLAHAHEAKAAIRPHLSMRPGGRPPQPMPPFTPPVGNALQATALVLALDDMIAGAAHDDPSSGLLGSMQPTARRDERARRALVVCGCLLDPDAQEWLRGTTGFAAVPWDAIEKVAVSRAVEEIRLAKAALAALGAPLNVASSTVSDDATAHDASAVPDGDGPEPEPSRAQVVAPPSTPATDFDVQVPAATALDAPTAEDRPARARSRSELRVLKTMRTLSTDRLYTIEQIAAAAKDAVGGVSARTIERVLPKLIEEGIVERPLGEREGARLSTAGRLKAHKLAD